MRLTKKQTKTLEEALTAPLLASTEELRGRVLEIAKNACANYLDHDWESCEDCHFLVDEIDALLEQVAGEARLEALNKLQHSYHEKGYRTPALLSAALAKQSGRE